MTDASSQTLRVLAVESLPGGVAAGHRDAVSRTLVDEQGGAVKVSVCEMAPGGCADPHAHPDARQTLLVLEGELVVDAGGAEVVVGPQEAVVLDPSVRHAVANRGAAGARYIAVTVCVPEGESGG
jgi:quercetin dioxygenase-like cupin family protein